MMLAAGGAPLNCQNIPALDSTGVTGAVETIRPGGTHEGIRAEVKSGLVHQHHDAVGREVAVNL